ncbi:MAG: PatB family C-S lyase, partial [Turicibacter sp.]
MKYNFDEVISRSGTNCVKWEFMNILYQDANQDTLPMWVADMDFPCPQPVIDAIKNRADKRIFGYSAHHTGSFYRSVGSWLQRRLDWYVHSGDIKICGGVVPALGLLVKSLTKEGDGVIIQRPVYYPFTSQIENNDRVVVNNSLINTDGYYTIDFEDLEEKAKDPNNTMMILCSPHNPVGRVWTEEELRHIADICLANDVILVSDEIHYDLMRKGVTHTPVAKLFPNEDRIITCMAPSKTFNLAGMHTSYIIIPNDEHKKKYDTVAGMTMMSPISIVAAEAAHDEGEEWLEQVREYLDGNFEFIGQYLKENLPLAKYVPSEGTYLAWIDLSAYESDGEALDRLVREEANVLLDGGTMFGIEGNGFQRINAACPRSLIKECLDRITTVLKRPRIGQALSNFTYNTPWENGIDFSSQSKDSKSCMVFLRYYGCTLCQLDIRKFMTRYNEFAEKGVELYIVLQSDRQ